MTTTAPNVPAIIELLKLYAASNVGLAEYERIGREQGQDARVSAVWLESHRQDSLRDRLEMVGVDAYPGDEEKPDEDPNAVYFALHEDGRVIATMDLYGKTTIVDPTFAF